MDSMMAALKARRGSGMGQAGDMPESENDGMGMKELAMQLTPEQKQELMTYLSEEPSNDTSEVEKGGPSSGEKLGIEEKIADQGDEDASDDVQMGMLDKNSLQKAESGARPRGLGDRAKMYAATKLKSKGKMR